MHLTLVAIGSRGDVEPYWALGGGLHEAGHEVRLATHRRFEGHARRAGLAFAPLEADPRAVLEGERGVAWQESGRNPLLFTRGLRKVFEPLAEQLAADVWDACQETEGMIFSGLALAGSAIADALGVPWVAANLRPSARTRAFPSPFVPARSLGGSYNWLSYVLAEQIRWQPLRRPVNAWLRARGLTPLPLRGPYAQLERGRRPLVLGYSPAVVPRPADWGDWIHLTGYWFSEPDPGWRPPAELTEFLASGPPPVYVGFGSMTIREPEALLEIVLGAITQAEQRAILLSGWAGLSKRESSSDVLVIDEVPFEWLFPRMAAVVHHGGAGTTAAGLRAGVPAVVVPFFADHPFWAQRVHALGAGPAPLPAKRLSAELLATRIRHAASDPATTQRATALGEQIAAEDGITRAVEVLEQHFEGPSQRPQ